MVTSDTPHVADEDRVSIEAFGQGFYRVTLRYGFMEDTDVPAALALGAAHGLAPAPEHTTYFLGVETLLSTHREGMPLWWNLGCRLSSRGSGLRVQGSGVQRF